MSFYTQEIFFTFLIIKKKKLTTQTFCEKEKKVKAIRQNEIGAQIRKYVHSPSVFIFVCMCVVLIIVKIAFF